MSEKKYTTLKDFYPYYLTEHSDPVCRTLHYIGTSLFLGLIVWSMMEPVWWKFLLMPLSGYGFAWAGHFIFEKNKPATFQYPLFSFRSDFIMFYHFLTGQVEQKLEESKNIVNGTKVV